MDEKLKSNFSKALFDRLETQISFNTTFHPQTNGKTKRINRILEDMLCMHVMDKPTKWEDYLNLVEFSYHREHQSSSILSPFEYI